LEVVAVPGFAFVGQRVAAVILEVVVVVAMGVAVDSLEVVTLEVAAVVALNFVVDALVVVVVTLGNIAVPVALELAVVLQKLGVPWLVAAENSTIVAATIVVLVAAAVVVAVVVEEVIVPASLVHWFEEVMKEKQNLEFPLVKMQSNLVAIP
jgi:hypothetical protein